MSSSLIASFICCLIIHFTIVKDQFLKNFCTEVDWLKSMELVTGINLSACESLKDQIFCLFLFKNDYQDIKIIKFKIVLNIVIKTIDSIILTEAKCHWHKKKQEYS